MVEKYIVVTSDDLQPLTLPLFYKYWVPLKEKHPGLKVTFYVSPFNQEIGQGEENNILLSDDFKEWYKKNKEWCLVELHGNTHEKPPENMRAKDEQEMLIAGGVASMLEYLDNDCLGYKPPFYRADDNTITILTKMGFSWYSQWWWLCPLKPIKKPIPHFIEISSHTNLIQLNNPDNINFIYKQIDEKLTLLEQQGYIYGSFREIMKEAMMK